MIASPLNQQCRSGKTTLALHATGQCSGEGLHVSFIDAGFRGSAFDGSELSDQRTKKHFPWLLTSQAWCPIRRIAKRYPSDAEASIKVLAISTARGVDTTHFTSRLNAHLAYTSHARAKVTAPVAGSKPPDMPRNLRTLAFPSASGGLS